MKVIVQMSPRERRLCKDLATAMVAGALWRTESGVNVEFTDEVARLVHDRIKDHVDNMIVLP